MGLRRCIVVLACVALASCGNDPTTVLVRIGATQLPVVSLTARAWVDGSDGGVSQPVGGGSAVTLPGSAVIRLDADVSVLLHVRVVAQLADGTASAASGVVQTEPHHQVTLDLLPGAPFDTDAGAADLGDDGGGGGNPDLSSTDLAAHVIAADDFNRANQPLWGTASDGQVWGVDANVATQFSIVSKLGVIAGGTGGTSYSAILGPTSPDFDVLVTGTLDTVNQSCNFGAVARYINGALFYKADLDGINLTLHKDQGGTKTVLAQTPNPILPGSYYNLRFQAFGSTLRARVWAQAAAEPATWGVTATDGSITGGRAGLRVLVPGCSVHVKSFQAIGN